MMFDTFESYDVQETRRLDEEERKEFIGQDIQKHIQSDIRKGD